MRGESSAAIWRRWQGPLQVICTPRVIRQACLAALLIGSILVLLNQGDVLFSGQLTGSIIRRSLLTPIIPFCVIMLGAFLNSRTSTRAEDLRPGWAAIRRSSLIAVGVGGTILTLHHGHLLFAGTISPSTWVKIAVTPCVPFCVSLYGAYVAYWNAPKP